ALTVIPTMIDVSTGSNPWPPSRTVIAISERSSNSTPVARTGPASAPSGLSRSASISSTSAEISSAEASPRLYLSSTVAGAVQATPPPLEYDLRSTRFAPIGAAWPAPTAILPQRTTRHWPTSVTKIPEHKDPDGDKRSPTVGCGGYGRSWTAARGRGGRPPRSADYGGGVWGLGGVIPAPPAPPRERPPPPPPRPTP